MHIRCLYILCALERFGCGKLLEHDELNGACVDDWLGYVYIQSGTCQRDYATRYMAAPSSSGRVAIGN